MRNIRRERQLSKVCVQRVLYLVAQTFLSAGFGDFPVPKRSTNTLLESTVELADRNVCATPLSTYRMCLHVALKWNGEHTRRRVWCSAPSPNSILVRATINT